MMEVNIAWQILISYSMCQTICGVDSSQMHHLTHGALNGVTHCKHVPGSLQLP